MKNTARAAAKFGVKVVNGFTGSSIWHLLYSFPPNRRRAIEKGLPTSPSVEPDPRCVQDEAALSFALEVHPTEIAFDIASAQAALDALDGHRAFGFNYDPSHLGYQGVDYVAFIRKFADRIYHVHMKDVYWSQRARPRPASSAATSTSATPAASGISARWGAASINFEEIIRALNDIDYSGPLSVEWEDSGMDREHGATEACDFVRQARLSACQRCL